MAETPVFGILPPVSEWDEPARPESIAFFEKAIGGHDRVRELIKRDSQTYDVVRYRHPDVRVWVCSVYRVSAADVSSILAHDPRVDAIVTMSNWNHVTEEAKAAGSDRGVGVFEFAELMGALNYSGDDFVDYVPGGKRRKLG